MQFEMSVSQSWCSHTYVWVRVYFNRCAIRTTTKIMWAHMLRERSRMKESCRLFMLIYFGKYSCWTDVCFNCPAKVFAWASHENGISTNYCAKYCIKELKCHHLKKKNTAAVESTTQKNSMPICDLCATLRLLIDINILAVWWEWVLAR